MSNKNEILPSMKELEQNFNKKISNLAISSAQSKTIAPINLDLLQTQVKKDLNVDVIGLSKIASELVEKNDSLSEKEVAVELLKNIATTSKSKTLRKIASKMVKEKWWEK
jgi:hypothetical protein